MALIFEDKDKATFSNTRIKKIINYAERQKKRTASEKEKDFEEIDEFQQEWFEARMKGNARSWETWDGHLVKEEWGPWNRFGVPVNIWGYYKLQ